jgi:hypothetical protein
LCVAITTGGKVATSTNPAASRPTWSVGTQALLDPNSLPPIACASASVCVAGDVNGTLATSADASRGPQTWTVSSAIVPVQPCDHYGNPCQPGLVALDCPSSSLCVAEDGLGQGYVTHHPAAGGMSWAPARAYDAREAPPATNVLTCPTENICLSSGYYDPHVFVTGPAAPLRADYSQPDPGAGIDDLWCASATLCLAETDELGGMQDVHHVYASTDPAATDARWKLTLPVARGDFIQTVSCPSRHLCIAASSKGAIYAGWLTAPKARIAADLKPQRISRAALSKNRATMAVNLPEPGHLSERLAVWQRNRASSATLATSRATFTQAGRRVVRLVLTNAGRRRIASLAPGSRVVIDATFTPDDAPAISTRQTTRLS